MNIQLVDSSTNVENNPYLSDSDLKKGIKPKKRHPGKGKLLPPTHLQSKPMTPQCAGVNQESRNDNIQTFLYSGPMTSSSDNIIQIVPQQPHTVEGLLSHSSTIDHRNTKVSTDSNHQFNTESNSNLQTFNLLSNRTQDGNFNMPVSLAQHMLVQEKFM